MKSEVRASLVVTVLLILQAAFTSAGAAAQTKPAPPDAAPAPATIRVGFVTPKVQMVQPAADAAEAVRATLAADLTGTSIQLVPLDARLPEPIEAEAREKGCAYVLYTSLTLKRGSSGGGFFGRVVSNAASTTASRIPGGGVGATVARTEAADVVYRAVAGIKAHDELTLDYKLFAAGASTPSLAQGQKAKAKQDGEDILSPLVEKTASALLKELTKK